MEKSNTATATGAMVTLSPHGPWQLPVETWTTKPKHNHCDIKQQGVTINNWAFRENNATERHIELQLVLP